MDERIREKIRKRKKFVLERVPFYRNHVKQVDWDADNFDEFPLTDKKMLREMPEAFLSRKDGLVTEFTSGSTGFPLILYKTKAEMMYLESLLIRERKKAVPNFNKLKLVKFYAELHTGADRCYEKIHRENDILYLSMLHMDPESLQSYLETIKEEVTGGGWMMGPPSVISRFAQFICDTNQKCKQIVFVEFTGELLMESQRQITKKAFNCVTRNHYGSREFWCVAYECEKGHMHILHDHVFAENSEEGLLVSTLDQNTMPLIRYRIGDNCRVSNTPCGCGNPAPVLETFSGRTTDFIRTPSGREISSIMLYMIVVNLNLESDSVIRQFKVIQQTTLFFDVYLELGDKAKQGMVETYITENLNDLLGYQPTVQFHFVDVIPLDTRTGKLKYFVSMI